MISVGFLCASWTNGFPPRPVVVSSRTLAVPSSQHRHLQHRWGIPNMWRKQEGKSIGNGKVKKKLTIYVENMIIHTVWLLFDSCDKGVDVFCMFLLEGNVVANWYRYLGCSFGKPCHWDCLFIGVWEPSRKIEKSKSFNVDIYQAKSLIYIDLHHLCYNSFSNTWCWRERCMTSLDDEMRW